MFHLFFNYFSIINPSEISPWQTFSIIFQLFFNYQPSGFFNYFSIIFQFSPRRKKLDGRLSFILQLFFNYFSFLGQAARAGPGPGQGRQAWAGQAWASGGQGQPGAARAGRPPGAASQGRPRAARDSQEQPGPGAGRPGGPGGGSFLTVKT